MEGHPWLSESGLWFVSVRHQGHQNASAEEVEGLAARNGISLQLEYRLNVATSRAQSVVIVVGSHGLLEPECHSPRQMQLATALCPYVEMAQLSLQLHACKDPCFIARDR